LAVTSSKGKVIVVDFSKAEPILHTVTDASGATTAVTRVAYSPAHQLLFTANDAGAVSAWQITLPPASTAPASASVSAKVKAVCVGSLAAASDSKSPPAITALTAERVDPASKQYGSCSQPHLPRRVTQLCFLSDSTCLWVSWTGA
jgi:hypothetical protein